MKQHLLLKN